MVQPSIPDPSLYTYPSPLEGWENLPALPNDRAADGKSFINPPSEKLSPAYTEFTSPITSSNRGGFDIHIYFLETDSEQVTFATQLWERIRREFPELRIYQIFDRPLGPHPIGMFEVNLFTPAQFGAFIAWLVINRGPLSVLVHPNTGDDLRDHSQRATWMGQQLQLNFDIFAQLAELKREREKKETEQATA